LELFEHDVRSSNFVTSVLTANGQIILPREDNITFRGYSQDGGDVRLTVKDDFINGYVVVGGERYFIEQAKRFTENTNNNDYIVYAASDVQPDANAKCGVTDAEDKLRTLSPQGPNGNAPSAGDCFTVELAIASDFSMYTKYGTVGGVTTQALSVMNNVNGDWALANGLVDGVEFEIVEQLVSTCATCDPWSSTTDSGILLGEFNSWGNGGGFNNVFDLGQMWTDRDICRNGSCNVIGLASVGVVCGSSRFHLLEDYTANSSNLRSLVTHEIGHNFNCPHNYEIDSSCDPPGRTILIMDPINNGATSWSDGTPNNCEMNSIATIDAHINSAGVNCLDACAAVTCAPVSGLNITSQTSSSIAVSWTGTVGSYRVRIRDMFDNSIVSTMTTNSTSITMTPPLVGCKNYQILVDSDCGGTFSEIQGALFQTDFSTDFVVTDISTSNCLPATYDLTIILTHTGGNASGFNVTIDGTDYLQSFGASPQTITINGLIADGLSKSVTIAAVSNGGGDCDAFSSYEAPPADCSLSDVVTFDNCALPSGWTISSTNNLNWQGGDNYEWKFDGSGRPIQNYGGGSNGGTSKTIDGTCMAYLDDDVNGNPLYTGNITMTTEAIDATPYGALTLSFDYNFHNFEDAKPSNNSLFRVDVWNGTTWVTVLTDDDDTCPWFNVWQGSCTSSESIDVATHINANFQVRFFYTDGDNGASTGMIALDNYSLIGTLANLPVELSSFNGRRNNKVVNLNWVTSSETNNDYFTLERSADGRNFEALTEVKGAGTTTTSSTYEFTDAQPLKGHNYYRLVQTDFDGKSEYVGDIVLVDFYNEGEISIQPNPVKGNHFSLLYASSEDNHRMEAEIYSINGQLMYATSFEVVKGQNNWNVQVDNLSQGIYILKTREGNKIKHFKFIKS